MGRPADDPQPELQHISTTQDDRPSFDKHDAADIREIQGNANYYETITAAPLDPWSKTSFQLYLILLVAALNATASGFDGSIFSSINAMPQYQKYFHHNELGSATGIIFMIYTIGNMIGSLFTGPICDRFGRRAGMITGSVLIMVGAAVQTAARSDAYLLGGRFVLGFGVSIGTSSAPTYALELAPPQWRARVVGYYNTFFYTGAILATGVAYAAIKSPGETAFRLPLGLQLIPPLFICAGALLVPESPRWLTMWGKKDQAAAILAKYHGGGDMQHPMVQLELREFEAGIELQKKSATSIWNYYGLVDSHNARWRFAMMAFMSVFAQLSGNSVLTYYLPSMYKLLGVKTPERKLLLTFANTIVSGAGAVAGSALNDSVGRRTKLWVGSIVLAGLFGGVTGFSSYFEGGKTDVSSTITNGGIAFIFLFGCAYSFIYTPLTATYCAEVLSTPMRAKGMGIHVILSNCANLYNTYVTAVALEAIDFRYYFVFVGLNLTYAAVWYFLGVETRGRTLEEMDEVFNARFPPRAALQKAVMVKQSNGHLADASAVAGHGERA
ncbi:Hexose transport-related protein, putative [Beauveria bassiana ARSEF 2860]|uniref:Hexose transport-related protein, putative n=1 Tax=Beauveria bassiana (strain ARSEF 2860) TaxID=655819 RepID=J4UGF0_BEAB2|nr:Hexose transport-related protein, putative [Beauveria bassiana ARSEF 2860]EJP61917.1 Hexose transport-related protein, putative [Beauveria bassiana ARSEF 2860]